MDVVRKRYQRVLHHCLVRMQLSEEEFRIMTTLTETEVAAWFGLGRGAVRRFIDQLGSIVKYQHCKQAGDTQALCRFRSYGNRVIYLWSDSVGLDGAQQGRSLQLDGLSLLSQYDRRRAVVFALRLGVRADMSLAPLAVGQPQRLGSLMAQVANTSAVAELPDSIRYG